ncbi:acyltransferase family protein [Actinoplanes sp. NPDC000266]
MRRVAGLDGIRGLLALYVVAHHCWLLCHPGYPANTGSFWGGWLIHGRLAVVAFITLSGFSLALAPARDGWRLGGVLRFARRRARRILPAYWAALAVSLVLAGSLPMTHIPTEASAVVYGLLLQDFVAAPAPNGAFWSIAVEAGLYVLFPLLVLLRRRAGTVVTLVAVCAPVTAIGLFRPDTIGYTWQMAPLFAMGAVAAGAVRTRGVPWALLAALAATPVLVVVVWKGSVWTAGHYFWIDLAAGPAIALFLVAVATGRPAALVRLLTIRPVALLGWCSYSLYLMHVPVVGLVVHVLGASFGTTVAVAVPASVVTASVFARLFEGRTGMDHRAGPVAVVPAVERATAGHQA